MTLFNQNLLYKKTTMTMAGQQTFIENTFLPTIPMIYPTTYQALLTSPSTKDLTLNADKEITILLSPKEIQNISPPYLPKLEFDTQLNPFWNFYTNINQRLKVQTPPPSSPLSPSYKPETPPKTAFLQANISRLHLCSQGHLPVQEHHALHQVDQQLWPQSPLQVLEQDPTHHHGHHQEHHHVWIQSHLPVIQD
jgi:hypothetical protein